MAYVGTMGSYLRVYVGSLHGNSSPVIALELRFAQREWKLVAFPGFLEKEPSL